MVIKLLLLLGLALGTSGQATPETKVYPSTYWFLFPQTIRPGLDLTVRAHILKASKPVNIQFTLVNGSSNTAVHTFPQHTLQPDVPQTLQLRIPSDLANPGYPGYKINLTGSGGLDFNSSQNVNYERKSLSIFVQTDKDKYKPGDTVRFRVVAVEPTLKVVRFPMDIVIKDPRSNRIAQWLGVSVPRGVYEGSMATSSEPIIGQWHITVTIKGQSETKAFTIAHYVLPQFEAKVELPPYGVTNSTEIKGKVNVKYTFGKPVEGKAHVTLQMKHVYNWLGRKAVTISHQIQIVKGTGEFRFSLDELREVYINNTNTYPSSPLTVSLNNEAFTFKAIATEALTGKTAEAQGDVTLYDNPYDVQFSGNPSIFKPGMNYFTMVKITKKDGTSVDSDVDVRFNITMQFAVTLTSPDLPPPIGHPAMPSISIETPGVAKTRTAFKEEIRNPYTWPRYYTQSLTFRRKEFTKEGYVPFSIEIPKDVTQITVTAEALKDQTSLYATRAYSPSNSYIQIDMPVDTPKPKVGETTAFTVRGSEELSFLTYEVLSKGRLVATDTVKFPTPSRSVQLPVTFTSEMAPSAKFLVYYRRTNGEVVADTTAVSIDGTFDNPITLSYNKATVKPGDSVQLRVQTVAPDSLVQLLSVDKSVKLLGSDNDIDESRILKELNSYDYGSYCYYCGYPTFRWWWPGTGSATDASAVFSSAAVIVVTDANVYQYNQRSLGGLASDVSFARGFSGGLAAGMAMKAQAPQGDLKGPERMRTDFPETWLWESVVTDTKGEATLNTITPDTITTWVTTAFAVHHVRGLSVATKAAEVTTLLPLFIRPELPYSVIRGEVVCLQVTSFNYANATLPLQLTLDKSQNFDNVRVILAGPNSNPKEETFSSDITYNLQDVEPDGARSVYYCIKPRTIGNIVLNFTLKSNLYGDGVTKTLLVEPEGVPRSEFTAVLADVRSPPNTYKTVVNFTTPANAVNGSISVRINIAGDVLGPTLNNLGSLIAMPYGCGEQNMINFAPNVYVYDYLRRTNRLDAATKAKIEDYTLKGYQRELTYRMADGSFSTFGEGRGSKGSTWLTAFVTKCFIQASDMLEVDPEVIHSALLWIARFQASNGSFQEPGTVFNKQLQGGSGHGEALAAYVLITLKEAQPWVEKHFSEKLMSLVLQNATDRARRFLEQQLSSLSDPYDLAIVTYALGLANSASVNAARTRLEATAITQDGTRHYERADSSVRPKSQHSWYNPTDSLAVEATAYALCDAARQGDLHLGLQLLRWLSSRRNPNGGFISTQDTVIALQCLADYGSKIYSNVTNMTVTVTWGGSTTNFVVDKDTSLLLQSQDLKSAAHPGRAETVTIEARGTGLAAVDVVRRYHVVEEAVDISFDLNVTLEREKTESFLLRACTSYKISNSSSSMAVMEVGIPTGFAPDLGDSHAEVRQSTRQDQEDRKLILYFDAISHHGVCVAVPMVMLSKVARGQPNAVTVYDYYQPRDATTRLYNRKNAGVCEVCAECSICPARTR